VKFFRGVYYGLNSFLGLELMWGWIFLERTRILSGIQFSTYFIEFAVVKTKRFVGSTVNVILTRQTCGQRSSRVAGGKHWASAFYFPIWIWHMFWGSKSRGSSDLGLCTTSGLAKTVRLRSADFRLKNVFGHRICRKSALRRCTLSASPEDLHRPISDSPLHFDS